MRKIILPEDGPEIFKKPYWLRKDQLRKEIVYAKYYHDPKVRMSYILDYIPWSWRDIVCVCDLPGGWDNKCSKCHKYARWMFRRSCLKCEKPFVIDFYHKDKNGQTCFDCLQEKSFDPVARQADIGTPKQVVDIDAEGVYDIPAVPTFEL